MDRAASGTSATSSQRGTLAFHFRYIMPGEWIDSQRLAVKLLERVIRAVRPNLKNTGTLIVRMGKLVYTQDLDRPDWEEISKALPIQRLSPLKLKSGETLTQNFPPDRVFVVSLCGRIGRFENMWLKRLERYVRHPVLFSHQVDVDNVFQEWAYLRCATTIGELHSSWRLELAFEAIEYEEDLPKMLSRLGLKEEWSTTALRAVLALLDESKLPPTPC